MLEIKKISKKYASRSIINNFSVSLPNKGMILLHGENGSGKTTLLKIISNNIKYDGKVVLPEGLKTTDIFYLASEEHLYDYLKVSEKAKLLLNDNELSIFNDYVNKYDLEYILNYKVGKLSSGERQKFELIIALSRKAPITLLDEPLEYVDKESKPLFIEEIINLSKDSLVIESSPKDYHDADYILEFEMNKIDVVCNNKNVNSITETGIKHKIRVKDYFKVLFRRNGLLSLSFNLVIMLLVCLFTSSILLFNTSAYNQVESVINKYDTGLYYSDSTNADSRTLINNSNLDTNFTYPILELGKLVPTKVTDESGNVMKEMKYHTSYYPERLIEIDHIYVKGEKVELCNGEVYVPDYVWDMTLTSDKVDGIPAPIDNEYKDSEVLSSFSGLNKGLTLTIKKYDTDYKEYIPTTDKSVDELGYNEELSLFNERKAKYYDIAIMNKTTLMYFLDNFRGMSKDTLDKYVENTDGYDKNGMYHINDLLLFKYKGLDVLYGKWNLEAYNINDNEFYCNKEFASKYLNLTPTEYMKVKNDKINPHYFDFEIAGVKYENMKFKQFVGGEIKQYPILFLSYNDSNKLYTEGKFNEIESYELECKDIISTNSINELLDPDVEFMSKNHYDTLVNNKNYLDTTFKNGIVISIVLMVVLSIIYLLFIYKNEMHSYKALKNKGYNSLTVIMSSYLLRVIIFAALLLVGFFIAEAIINILAIIFKIII